MSKALEDTKKVLAQLPPRPWKTDLLNPPPRELQGLRDVGALRTGDGQNIFEPFPESQSFVMAPIGVLDALVKLVVLTDALVAELDRKSVGDTEDVPKRPVSVRS